MSAQLRDLLTVAITHCDRALYLHAAVRSMLPLSACSRVLVDNGSTEELASDVLEEAAALGWDVVRRPVATKDWVNDEYHAKNAILDRVTTPLVMFVQDDTQLIAPAEHVLRVSRELLESDYLAVNVDAVRRVTLERKLATRDPKHPSFWTLRDHHFPTVGIFKMSTFQQLGPYAVSWPQTQEHWGRSEDVYDQAVKQLMPDPERIACWSHVPLLAGIWNDPRGGYAFVRQGRRYGHYLPPPNGETYYRALEQDEVEWLEESARPANFSSVARPVGWSLPIGSDGDIVKYPQSRVIEEGPAVVVS